MSNTNASHSSSSATTSSMPFLHHLEELRWHLIRIIIAILVCGIVAFFSKSFVFDYLLFGPKRTDFWTYRMLCEISKAMSVQEASMCMDQLPFVVQSRKVAGQFSIHIWTAILVGFIASFPYALYEVWRFIAPALYEKERKYTKGFIFICSFLFFLGVLFGYYIITPLSIHFLATYSVSSEIVNEFDIDSYVALVRTSVLSCGVIFELPVLIYFFARIGLVQSSFLRKHRKYALIIVLALSAVITPPDVASQIIVSSPILVLYEVSILITHLMERNNKQQKNIVPVDQDI